MQTELTIKTRDASKSQTMLLEDGFTTIGREPSSTIVLNSYQVSRNHAAFYLRERFGILTVEDHGSLNGTLVNGEPIKRKILYAGDIVQIGEFEIVVKGGSVPSTGIRHEFSPQAVA